LFRSQHRRKRASPQANNTKPLLLIPNEYFKIAGDHSAASRIADIDTAVKTVLGHVPSIHLLTALNELALANSRIADGVASAHKFDGKGAVEALHTAALSIASENCDVFALGNTLASNDSGYSLMDRKHSFAAMTRVSTWSRPMVERVVLQVGRHFRGVLRHVTPRSAVPTVACALVSAVHAAAFGISIAFFDERCAFADGYKYYIKRLVADLTDSAIVKGPGKPLQTIQSALVGHTLTSGGQGNEHEMEDDTKAETPLAVSCGQEERTE
jgi:hypothetical protein